MEKNRLHTVAGQIVEGIITIDSWGYINDFNSAAEKIFGYARKEILGQKVNMLMPEPDRSKHDEYMKRYALTGNKNRFMTS